MAPSASIGSHQRGIRVPRRPRKSLWGYRLRLSLAVAGLLVGAGLPGCGSDPDTPPDPAGDAARAPGSVEVPAETHALLERWTAATTGGPRDRTRAERLADVSAVLEDVPPGRLRALCADADGFPDPERRSLRTLARAAAGDDPGAVDRWVALLADPAVGEDCRDGVVMALQRARDVLDDDATGRISDALIDLADERDGAARERWEELAAQFGESDRVRDRVAALLRSSDDHDRARAARLAKESRDPRTADLVAEYLYRLAEAPRQHPESLRPLVEAAAHRAQGAALPGLEKVIFAAGTPDVDAVAALGAIRSERTLVVIENAYTARDRVPDEDRAALDAALHRAVRGVEPVILGLLRDGDPGPASRAVRVLARAEPTGPFARVDALRSALEDHAATRPEPERAEILELAARVGARD